MIKELEEFEEIIKSNKSIFFDKVWEKADNTYKLIYNIQGYVTENDRLYPNLKIIFWINELKNDLSEDVITYLYKQNCDYRTETIDNNIEVTFNKILSYIYNEDSTKLLRNLILNGQDYFNKIIDKNKYNDFAQSVEMFPIGNRSCLETFIDFELKMNSGKYEFRLKMIEENWELTYLDDVIVLITINDICEKILEYIYED